MNTPRESIALSMRSPTWIVLCALDATAHASPACLRGEATLGSL